MITKVIAIAAIKPDAFCSSKWVDGVEVVTYESGVTPIDESLVNAKVAELQAIQDYQSKRVAAYPSQEEQFDMQYWDSVNGTTTWKDAIAKVKSDNPKPS